MGDWEHVTVIIDNPPFEIRTGDRRFIFLQRKINECS